ncbi:MULTISPECIES: ABC-F family ATP-binding cassette domain-containing protein [Mammaliicoccus]|uniref:ABC transporter ATP-binding protein n=1 Tax=Mammaliicoccus vitulinus TaxID=71237 RepID=A0A2T4PUJ7_9STAP|nr:MULTISPECIES: ATP-binding cassette domain-containing protein [Mammaliicoccus]HAL09275.1 ABC transporter ATP-binding protein [Staphylococcus sp.]MBM6630407.1 ATP-binding cassette domain-containing protein [Mammaliicoccus vitulinus]MBO3077055.1 ATP-binding cassette domain-containing protein [Mammaliicoccus vitulinus]MEB7656722.1 ATP-binding cassette domain-containing protein [Mammaliicoccus vitulinus]PNZ40847.1 ABC transporter ATP-binding protein [Mammaliicoccus vitulinus]
MLQVTNVSLRFGDRKLFEDVSIKFIPGNCYGLIGANGAGKSTFLKVLSGELDSQSGHVSLGKDERLAVLKQDHFSHEDEKVIDVVLKGHEKLWQVMTEKNEIYMKPDFSDEDGMRAAELEGEFGEMNGWNAEADASVLLSGLGIKDELHDKQMSELENNQKVKVLLAQSLFGDPDVLLLDEPTNGLDIKAIAWLEDFLFNFENTVIVVSHDRHFLNNVCTHIADLDYGKIKLFVGNYDFWYQSSQLVSQMAQDQNKKKEERIKELEDFIARFSANASKSKQATSRKKMLDKIELDDIQPSSRRYPYVNFTMDRDVGNELLQVQGVSKTIDGKKVLSNVSFTMNPNDKAVLIGESEIAKTTLLRILAGELEPDEGTVKWGVTTSQSYLPKDNSEFFEGVNLNLVDWLRQYAPPEEQTETFLRGFLGRMLFSGEEVKKKANVLSGGEKVRCMLSKMMLSSSNVLLLDEPTNHLDLESITAVNDGLKNFKGSLIFTSFDFEFINTIANRVIDIKEDGVISKEITYEEYLKDSGLL